MGRRQTNLRHRPLLPPRNCLLPYPLPQPHKIFNSQSAPVCHNHHSGRSDLSRASLRPARQQHRRVHQEICNWNLVLFCERGGEYCEPADISIVSGAEIWDWCCCHVGGVLHQHCVVRIVILCVSSGEQETGFGSCGRGGSGCDGGVDRCLF